MQQLNNLDVIILIVIGISALIALSRGLVKEVLSIIGWVLSGATVIYLLPILNPITMKYVESGWMAGIATSIFILIVFMIVWILTTGNIVNKIRSSKLSSVDRILGLFFGVVRAILLVILMYIMVSWMMPKKSQPELLQKSKYFNIAGEFAAPIEKLIPKATLDAIREKSTQVGLVEDENKAEDKDQESKVEKKEIQSKDKNEVDALFEKLAQPQIEKMREDKKKLEKIKEDFDGYNNHERDNLDRLIETTLE